MILFVLSNNNNRLVLDKMVDIIMTIIYLPIAIYITTRKFTQNRTLKDQTDVQSNEMYEKTSVIYNKKMLVRIINLDNNNTRK